jgi:hypothetical protein
MGICAYYDRITPEQASARRRARGCRSEVLDRSAERTRHLDIDKSWDDLHRILNDEPGDGSGPLWNAIEGGEYLDESEIDPKDEASWENADLTRILTPDEVLDTARALAEISEPWLRERFDVVREGEVRRIREMGIRYERNRIQEAERFEYLAYHFGRLTAFFLQAAQAGDAMLLSRA